MWYATNTKEKLCGWKLLDTLGRLSLFTERTVQCICPLDWEKWADSMKGETKLRKSKLMKAALEC